MKRLSLVFALLVGILAVGCGQISSLQGRYDAAGQSVYSAIEILPDNVAKIYSPFLSSAYTTSFDRKGNFIFIKSDRGDLGYEIVDSNTLKGPGGGFMGTEAVEYKKPAVAVLRPGTVQTSSAGTSSATKAVYNVGDIGPAGGLIFYDKGSYSDGWRYLEAAPNDQSTGIPWSTGSNIDIKTGTAVGTGKANTDAIIAAQGSGNYAASLCKNLSINGFSDWFLPSKDELALMYTNLKKAGLGGFGEGWLWSSSQYKGYLAWVYRFSDGLQGLTDESGDGLDDKCSVRVVRVF
jgi:hypothetical protein